MKLCSVCRDRHVCVKVCPELEVRLPKDYTGKDPKMEVGMDPSGFDLAVRRHSYAVWELSERPVRCPAPDLSSLTAKERNALLLLAGGMSMRAAARRLKINLNALQCRVASARRKLGAGQSPHVMRGGCEAGRNAKGGAR